MKGNPWAFGIVFIIVVVILMWNGFGLPTVFLDETKITKGVVIKNQSVPYLTHSSRQMLTYLYLVDDSIYSKTIKIKPLENYQPVGTKIKVRYSSENPTKNEIQQFLIRTYPVSTNYFWNDSLTTEELKFEGDIVFIEKRTLNNELISTEIFEFLILENYIAILPLFSDLRSNKNVIRRFDIEITDKERLVEQKTGRVYR